MPKTQFLDNKKVEEAILARDIQTTNIVENDRLAKRLHSSPEGITLSLKKKDYEVSDSGLRSLLRTVDLPASLSNKLREYPGLLEHNMKKMLEYKPGESRLMIRNNQVVGIADPKVTIIKNEQILDSIHKNIKDVKFSRMYAHDDGSMHLSAINVADDKMKVAKDDYFQSGVNISNDPMGGKGTQIEGHLIRLACLNGMTATETVYKSPRTIEGSVSTWLNGNIKQAGQVSQTLFNSVRELKNQKLDVDPMDFLEGLFVDLDIPVSVQNSIMKRMSKHGADNAYDVMNHMTYVASHIPSVIGDANLSNRLMRASGYMAEHTGHVCGSCRRVMLN